MNKKIIMLISALICANSMVFASQRDIISSLTTTGLGAGDNKIYQTLVAKYQSKKLTAEDNTLTNITILHTKEGFLKSKMTNKSSLWPYWLATSLGTIFLGTLLGLDFAHTKGLLSYSKMNQIGDIFENIYFLDVDTGPKLIYHTLIYNTVPLIAFYGLYRKYSFLQNQQQELEMVRDMLVTLKSFGTPSLN